MKKLLFIGVVAMPAMALSQVIADRATFNTEFPTAATEDFESFQINFNNATNLEVSVLDSTTVTNDQGPGLVLPGATYIDPSETQLQWNGDGHFQLPTRSLLANGNQGILRIEYDEPMQAFALDVFAFQSNRAGAVRVYSGGDLVHTFDLSGVSNTAANFVGFKHSPGITAVEVDRLLGSYSLIIDNHSYTAVPEPATLAALCLGALALVRRRKQ
ncbi:MAG: PEP-CTERM sorting domain-containing protein [Fimbriimonadaceae bacterium]